MSYYNLYNLSISERSLVKSPAVRNAKILLVKSDGGADGNKISFAKSISIVKSDEVERKVYGYVLEPDEVDAQGHKIDKQEIRKAVDRYNRNLALGHVKGTGTGYEHIRFDDAIGYPILNVYDETGEIAKALGIADADIIKGAWLTGDQLTENGYDMYQKGDFTGWSIGGVGEQEHINKTTDGEKSLNKSIDDQPLPEWIPQFYTKMKTLLDDEAPSIDEYDKEYIVKNTIAQLTFEVRYQALSNMNKSSGSIDKSNR